MKRIPDYRYTGNVKKGFLASLKKAQQTYGTCIFVLYEPSEERAWFFQDEDMARVTIQANSACLDPVCVHFNTALNRYPGYSGIDAGHARELISDFVQQTAKVSMMFKPDLYFLMRI